MNALRRLMTSAASLAPLAAAADVAAQPMGPGGWHGGWGWGHMVFGSFMMLLFLAAVVAAVVAVVRWTGGSSERREPSSPSQALAILEERFARGEIDREEFEERRRTLTS